MENRIIHLLEAKWERHSAKISLLLSFICGIMYYFNIIDNIRTVLSDVIVFASIVIGINGVFISLVITMKITPAFIRLKKISPTSEKKLFGLLRAQVFNGLTVVLLSIIITVLPYSPSKLLSVIGVSIWSFFLIVMVIGAYFTLNLITNLILANEEDPTMKRRS